MRSGLGLSSECSRLSSMLTDGSQLQVLRLCLVPEQQQPLVFAPPQMSPADTTLLPSGSRWSVTVADA